MFSHKFLSFDRDDFLVKKEKSDFYVTMGSCDGMVLCKLTGLSLLIVLISEFRKKKVIP